MDPLVRELQIEADYGQIYIYDPATQLPAHDATEDDDPLQRALEDGNESRRFVGYAGGLIDVLTPSQFNWKAPMRIEVSHAPPESDVESWDHVVELPLPVPSGRLVFQASGTALIECLPSHGHIFTAGVHEASACAGRPAGPACGNVTRSD